MFEDPSLSFFLAIVFERGVYTWSLPFTPRTLQSGHSLTTPPNSSPHSPRYLPGLNVMDIFLSLFPLFTSISPSASVTLPTTCYFNSLATLPLLHPLGGPVLQPLFTTHPPWASSLTSTALIPTSALLSSTVQLLIHTPLLSPERRT